MAEIVHAEEPLLRIIAYPTWSKYSLFWFL